jgi:sarcosine oxidase subunit alpha
MTTVAPIARTPLHHWHASHGARFTTTNGWQVPAVYTNADQEAAAARSGLAIADVSAFGKLSFRGMGVAALAQSLAPDIPATKPLGVTWLRGAEPALACRLNDEHLLLLSLTLAATPAKLELPEQGILATDLTSAYAGFLLIGPRNEDLLRRLTHIDVRSSSFPAYSCAETSLAGVEALLVRTPELAVTAMRIYVGWDMAEYVWARLLESGQTWGIAPIGLEAMQILGSSQP